MGDDCTGTLKIGGVEYTVDLVDCTCEYFFPAGNILVRHKFVLQEFYGTRLAKTCTTGGHKE